MWRAIRNLLSRNQPGIQASMAHDELISSYTADGYPWDVDDNPSPGSNSDANPELGNMD